MTAPRKGSLITAHAFENDGQVSKEPVKKYTCTRVEGSICYVESEGVSSCFIWKFGDGLNRLHFWKGKDSAVSAS